MKLRDLTQIAICRSLGFRIKALGSRVSGFGTCNGGWGYVGFEQGLGI